MRINDVLLKPIVTEKTIALYNREGVYTFKVALDATKNQIRQALKDTFDVEAGDVRTLVMPGKRRRIARTARFKTTPMFKKAVFKLKKGKLDFYTSE
ncbi:50S ribosomal protein L23 [candidate division WWE3 bacterium]|nr:50S ribosomal protein L23 [candidate division WWE3 bacterium]